MIRWYVGVACRKIDLMISLKKICLSCIKIVSRVVQQSFPILELLPMNKRPFSCPSASQQTDPDGVVTNQILLCKSCYKLKG
jgi:hypothetical protein